MHFKKNISNSIITLFPRIFCIFLVGAYEMQMEMNHTNIPVNAVTTADTVWITVVKRHGPAAGMGNTTDKFGEDRSSAADLSGCGVR